MVPLRWVRAFYLLLVLAIAFPHLSGCERSSSIPSPSADPIIADTPTPSIPSPTPSSANLPPVPASEAEIWSQLRQGQGYVILFRHALAPGTGDPANFQVDDCSTQRNLSDEGRQQARRTGAVLREQSITVGRVLSSQWCRCLETARLMDVGPVEPFPVLNSFFQDRSTEQSQTEQLREFILQNRETSGVTVMVTHQVNITAISNIVPQSGAAVVMRATASDEIELVGEISAR